MPRSSPAGHWRALGRRGINPGTGTSGGGEGERLVWAYRAVEDLVARALSAVRAPGSRVVLLRGPRGVGKTQVLDQVLRHLGRTGREVERVYASEITAAVPFGAVLHLLPPGTHGDSPTDLLRHTAGTLRERRRRGRPVVLGVDDAHLLDAPSAACIDLAVRDGLAVVVATAAPSPSSSVAVARALPVDGPGVTTVAFSPWGAAAVEELAETVLRAPVARAFAAELWARSEGYPLLVRLLLTAAHDEGRLRMVQGRWHLDGRLTCSGDVTLVVQDRMATLDDGARRALELIALGEPLDLCTSREVASAAALCELEDQGLVMIERSGQRALVRCAHPLYGEAVSALLPPFRRRLHREALIEALERTGCRRIGDRFRAACWRIEAGLPVSPGGVADVALKAMALLDPDLAFELLARAPDEPSTDLLVTEAVARAHAGDGEAADATFERAYENASGPDEQTLVIVAWSMTGCWVHDRADAAHARIDAALVGGARLADRTAARRQRESLLALRAQLLMFDERYREAAAAADEVLVPDGVDDAAAARALAVLATVAAYNGRVEDAHRLADNGMARAAQAGTIDPTIWAPLATAQVMADFTAGRLAMVRVKLDTLVRHLDASGGGSFAVLYLWVLAELLLLVGRTVEAQEPLHLARTLLPESVPLPARTVTESFLAEVAARSGRLEEGRSLLAALERAATPTESALFRLARLRAAVQVARAGRQDDTARALAVELAERTRQGGNGWAEARARFEAALLGSDQAGPLTGLAEAATSPLFDAMAAAAVALAAADPDALLDTAARFADLGAHAPAAELSARAAELAHGRHLRALAARATAFTEAQLDSCQELVPSPRERLISRHPAGTLTSRQRAIAALAASGAPNKDIADQLGLSRRTVENHLHHVFTKLGVTRRAELSPFFAAHDRTPAERG
jgi:DNA-binding CsgD family transcriptional regulator